MNRPICLGPVVDIPCGEGRTYHVGDLRLAVFRQRDERYFACESTCPHLGGPLADGLLGDGVVLCPLHALKFDLRTGECPSNDAYRVRTYSAWQQDGELYVALDEA